MPEEPARCKSCAEPSPKLLFSLGAMPPVNAFREPPALEPERAYPLDVFFCPSCALVQLDPIVAPEALFGSYLHLSSASQSNLRHLQEVARLLQARFSIDGGSRILEIGSNDGTLLSFLRPRAGVVLGVDPAQNLLPRSRALGVETLPDFFSPRLAEEIVRSRGEFDLVVALNVVAHTPDLIGLLGAIRTVLGPRGTLVMEAAYVADTILRGEFDTVYHEHVFSFSLHSLAAAFERSGLAAVDVERISTQGGSLRVFGQRKDNAPAPSDSVRRLFQQEEDQGLTRSAVYQAIEPRVKKLKEDLTATLRRLRRDEGPVVALGAPARGVVILNYCELGPADLAYVIDDTPLKQGRLVPGVHIPVFSWEALRASPASAFLLLSWNQQEEVLEKLRRYVPKATVVVPFPELVEKRIEFDRA